VDCLKCTGRLAAAHFGQDIEVMRCADCGGIWCTPDAVDLIRTTWLAEAALDIGNPLIGQRLDRVGDIQCPLGHGRLHQRSAADQPHIWYEACPTCNGLFFDAGELTDLKFNTLLDRVRDLLKGPRTAS